MATHIQVVLQQDMPNLGKSGELVKVRPGYARNYLLPRQLALPATTANVARIEHQKAGEDGRLFGSVGSKDIAAALAAQGVSVDKKKIQLAEPIKAVGSYEVPAKLGTDVSATIKVEVVAS